MISRNIKHLPYVLAWFLNHVFQRFAQFILSIVKCRNFQVMISLCVLSEKNYEGSYERNYPTGKPIWSNYDKGIVSSSEGRI